MGEFKRADQPLKSILGMGGKENCAKEIGDIGTPEALQFIQSLKEDASYEREAGIKYCVDLYAP